MVTFTIDPLNIPSPLTNEQPLLDGLCEDAMYNNGTLVKLQPYDTGDDYAVVTVVHQEEQLWICFHHLKRASSKSGIWLALQNQLESASFYGIAKDGRVEMSVFDFANMTWVQQDIVPPYFTGVASAHGGGGWSAELHIDLQTASNATMTSEIKFMVATTMYDGSSFAWPFLASPGRFTSWADAKLVEI